MGVSAYLPSCRCVAMWSYACECVCGVAMCVRVLYFLIRACCVDIIAIMRICLWLCGAMRECVCVGGEYVEEALGLCVWV